MNILFISENKNKDGPRIWKDGLMRHINGSKEVIPKNFGMNLFLPSNFKKISNSDILHFYTINSSIITYFIMNKILFKKKCVFTLHGNFIEEQKDKKFIKKLIFKKVYYNIIKNSDSITFPSKFLFNKIVYNYPELLKKSTIIPNGIEKFLLSSKKKINKDTIEIISVTNFKYYDKCNGVKLLIDTIKNIPDKHIKINIIGEGKYLDEIKNYNTDERINFLGYRDDVVYFIDNSDIFLHLTYLDNFPIVILEAMNCGKPILASNIGGIPEILPSIELVDNDVDKIKKQLDLIIIDKNYRKKLSKINRHLIKNLYWDKISSKFIKIYKITKK